ncbi:acyl-CoA dehydrogenase family protein [Alkalihalobacterium alkalinitrilicum]|uniref:acyl-CoA dehydrogenase family protein n=1 Tax=Alkalihalobacterium alkalinitrilicum TaxID=427920 RepID=UPI00114D824A|nr:acyl-CoA dehydrogenase family protein [Alkalihalobacterium alkalinitrilicum]
MKQLDFGLTKEQEMFQQTIRKLFTKSEVEKNSFSSEVWEGLAKVGILGLGIPEEKGGMGTSYDLIHLTGYEMGRALFQSPFYSTILIAGSILGRQTEEKWKRELQEIINGQKIISYIKADNNIVAERTDNQNWVLTGCTNIVTFASEAECFICEASNTLFYITKDQIEDIVPLELSDQTPAAQVSFNHVIISDDARLSLVDEANGIIAELENVGRMFVSSYMNGAMQEALNITFNYMKGREQFGKPISNFQALYHWAAELQTASEGAELLTRQVAWQLQYQKSADIDSRLALQNAARVYHACATASVQMAGGYGFMMEYDMQHFYRNAATLKGIYDYLNKKDQVNILIDNRPVLQESF